MNFFALRKFLIILRTYLRMLTIKRVFKNFNTVHLKVNSTAACQSGAKATANKSEVEREVQMIF